MSNPTTLPETTGYLLDQYLNGAEIVVIAQVFNPSAAIWPVLYMPAGPDDAYPWEAWYDGTRYSSAQVTTRDAYLTYI